MICAGVLNLAQWESKSSLSADHRMCTRGGRGRDVGAKIVGRRRFVSHGSSAHEALARENAHRLDAVSQNQIRPRDESLGLVQSEKLASPREDDPSTCSLQIFQPGDSPPTSGGPGAPASKRGYVFPHCFNSLLGSPGRRSPRKKPKIVQCVQDRPSKWS